MKILEVGAGKNYYKPKEGEEVTYLDSAKLPHINVVHDLNVFPYPFGDDEFDLVIANHVIEHLDDFIGVMKELHRIVKRDGILKIRVPNFADPSNFTPFHKHSFNHNSFDVFEEGHQENYYSDFRFKVLKTRYIFGKTLTRVFLSGLFNRFKGFYLVNFPYIFPANEIYFELQVVK